MSIQNATFHNELRGQLDYIQQAQRANSERLNYMMGRQDHMSDQWDSIYTQMNVDNPEIPPPPPPYPAPHFQHHYPSNYWDYPPQ